jgi:hypothetical protein
MTAADRFRVNEFLDAGAAFVKRFNVALVAIVVVVAMALFLWHSAKAEGERIGRGAAESVMRAMLADSSRVIESRVDARYQAIAFAEKAQTAAAASHQTARAKIVLVSDTVVQSPRHGYDRRLGPAGDRSGNRGERHAPSSRLRRDRTLPRAARRRLKRSGRVAAPRLARRGGAKAGAPLAVWIQVRRDRGRRRRRLAGLPSPLEAYHGRRQMEVL